MAIELNEEQKKAVKSIMGGSKTNANVLSNKTNVAGGLTGGLLGIAYAWSKGGSTIGYGLAGFLAGFIIVSIATSKKISSEE